MKKYFSLLVYVPTMALGMLGVVFTNHKLEQMKMIRGFAPGAIRLDVAVTNTGRDTAGNAYWVAWNDSAAVKLGRQRMNLPRGIWVPLEKGDTIEVTYLPGSRAAYHRNGIYAGDGNFRFDRALRAVEWLLVILSGGAFVVGGVRMVRKGQVRRQVLH